MKLSFSKIIYFLVILFLFLVETPLALADLPKPIPYSTFPELIIRVLQIALGLVGVVAVASLIYGGLVMITAAGNPERVKKAKDILIWAIFGIATIVLSYAMTRYAFEILLNTAG